MRRHWLGELIATTVVVRVTDAVSWLGSVELSDQSLVVLGGGTECGGKVLGVEWGGDSGTLAADWHGQLQNGVGAPVAKWCCGSTVAVGKVGEWLVGAPTAL